MKRIVLLGPPGCGKGTQSNLLVKNNGFIQLSTGDLLREETSNKSSELGQKINKLMEIGELVPDEIVISMVVEKVKKHQDKSIIFDGFPRNLNQAKVLDESLKSISSELDHVILFEVDFDILRERIKKRIEESNNQSVRKDDNSETLLKRIEVYKVSTLPIVNYYHEKNLLNKINGMEDIEKVNFKILKIIS
ncbi:MAG: adenylate kinase [Alphaproteobacteria bacterium]|tara:strand:- start:804 stop:1379 length:576 start_codon:yes stop_codon:yes gene_type:complete